MEFEITGAPGTDWTDEPRDLTVSEERQIMARSRVGGITLHRELTRSTLRAAVWCVDALRSRYQ